MSDERAYPAWGYCTHGFWYQGYWCCQDEQCEYRYEPVPAETADHDGYGLAAGPGADGENSLGDGTSGYGGAIAYDERRDDRQASSQQDQDTYQYHVQQYGPYQQDDHQHGGYQYSGYQHDGYHHGDYQQDDHRYNNQHGDQHGTYHHDVSQGDYRYLPNAREPVPPSDAATTGSGSSAAQTHSPSSTETPDNEDASMVGNADEDTEHREEREDRTLSYVQGGNGGGQGVDDVLNWFPECDAGDTQYPRKLSI